MTTIILVSIGVLIAAAAALFVIFYGGNAFDESATKAEASRLVSEGAQIEHATTLYYQQEGRLPGMRNGVLDDTQALFDLQGKGTPDDKSDDYLSTVPGGPKLTTTAEWTMQYGDDGMIYSRLGLQSDKAAMDVCRQARRQMGFKDQKDGDIAVYKCNGSDYPDAKWKGAGTLPPDEPCCIR